MKLYFSPGACSLAPHIALEEAGLAYELEQVDLKTKQMKSGGDFFTVNPKGSVPALRLDTGEILTEGPAIVQYIADQAKGKELAPPQGTTQHYRLIEWLNFLTSELHKMFSPLFRPTTPQDYKVIARENLAAKYAFVDKHLEGREFLVGERFSVADAYLFTLTRWTVPTEIDLSSRPNVVAFMQRVGARPHVAAVLKAEGF